MKRANGFYWVKRNGDWAIGLYSKTSEEFRVIWNDDLLYLKKDDLEEINERRISYPDEWPIKDNKRTNLGFHVEKLSKPTPYEKK
jgi:hypothetical protein